MSAKSDTERGFWIASALLVLAVGIWYAGSVGTAERVLLALKGYSVHLDHSFLSAWLAGTAGDAPPTAPFVVANSLNAVAFSLFAALARVVERGCTRGFRAALFRLIALSVLVAVLCAAVGAVPTPLRREFLVTRQTWPLFLVIPFGMLSGAAILTAAARALFPAIPSAPWWGLGFAGGWSWVANHCLPPGFGKALWLLDVTGTACFSRGLLTAGFTLKWWALNRILWLVFGGLLLFGARFSRVPLAVLRLSRDRSRAIASIVLCAAVVCTLEGLALWNVRSVLSMQTDVFGPFSALLCPTIGLVCVALALQVARTPLGVCGVPGGLAIAALVLHVAAPGQFSWSFLAARVSLDALSWFANLLLFSGVIRRWPGSTYALSVAALLVDVPLQNATSTSWLPLGAFFELPWSPLAGAHWARFAVLAPALCSVALSGILFLLCESRGRWRFRGAALAVVPFALWTSVLSGEGMKSRLPGGFVNLDARDTWRATRAARFDQLPHDDLIRALELVNGRLQVDVGQKGDSAHFSGSYSLRNAGAEPIDRVLVLLHPPAENVALGIDALPHAVAVDPVWSTVELPLEPPLESDQTREFRFAFDLERTFTRQGEDGLGGSVALGLGVMTGDFPLVGILPTFHLNGDAAVRCDPNTFQFETELVGPKEWEAQAFGQEVERFERDGRRVTRFHLEKSCMYFGMIAGGYQATEGTAASGTRIRALVTESRRPEVGSVLLDATDEVLTFESRVFGPFPRQRLTVAEGPQYELGQIAGVSFPGLIVLSDELLEDLSERRDLTRLKEELAHEMAHQWLQQAQSGFLDEPIAEVVALDYARTLGEEGRQLVLNNAKGYFSECSLRDEPTVAETRPGDPCATTVLYRKGGLGLLTQLDLIGPEQFSASLQQLLIDWRDRKPSDPAPDVRSLAEALKEKYQYNPQLLNEAIYKRITYRNVAEGAVATAPGEIDLKVTAHRFEGGASPERHEVAEKSYLPVGGIDCDGNPIILRWDTFDDNQPRTLHLHSVPLRAAGIDPWHELLDESEQNLIKVSGSACPASK